MSIVSDTHTTTKTIYPYGKPEKKKKTSDSLYINKKVNDWDVTIDVNEFGKLSLSASKIIGKIDTNDEATITVRVESTGSLVL
jgi:hypothetical protein